MSKPLNVLFLEDSPEDCALCMDELKRADFDPRFERVDNSEDFLIALNRQPWDVILADYTMPRFNALEGLRLLQNSGKEIPFIVVTGSINEETAVLCLKQGADDYILKDKMTRLGPAVQQAIRVYQERRERQNLEEQLRRAQKMEAIGQLAGGIAHDFNNILTAILGNAELAIDELEAPTPHVESIRDGLREIERSAERAAALTRQLLAFSRRQVTQLKILDLNRALCDLEKMLRRLITENIRLSVVTQDDLCRIKADPGQLEQVVMNLVVNARDAMPTGGQLKLETSNVVLDEEYVAANPGAQPGPHVLLSVRDTGCGMDRATRERVFEPFFTTKEVGQGTGLGLATVYGIIKHIGGHIGIDSEVGVGTTFRIYLPAVDVEQVAAEGGTMREMILEGSETVLVCEDDRAVRSMAVQMLQSAGYHVLEAENGEQALRLAQSARKPVQLLITDVIMPAMNGKELSKKLSQMIPGIKTLFVSGYTADVIAQHGVLGGDMFFLEKPFSSLMLLRRAREALGAVVFAV